MLGFMWGVRELAQPAGVRQAAGGREPALWADFVLLCLPSCKATLAELHDIDARSYRACLRRESQQQATSHLHRARPEALAALACLM